MTGTAPLPALFVSHGSPMMALEPSAARTFLTTLGTRLPRPRAILVVSAHHDAVEQRGDMTVTGAARPATIHDFRNFPPELFAMRYPAPGDPALAAGIAALLADAGTTVRVDPARGLDHGAWVPLSLIYPDADIPVVQLSMAANQTPEWHYALGAAIAPLRDENVLIIGSGSMSHNLQALMAQPAPIDAPPAPWVTSFTGWMAERIAAGATDDVLNGIDRASQGWNNHPTTEHLLPLFVAMGAGATALGGAGAGPALAGGADTYGALHGERLHASTTYGVLAMDVYAFG